MKLLVKIGEVNLLDAAYGRVKLTFKNKEVLNTISQFLWNSTFYKDGSFWHHFKSRQAYNAFHKLWKDLEKPWLMNFDVRTGKFSVVKK